MKTVCFFNSTSFWGGGEKLHLEYALYFAKKEIDVYIACKPDSPLHKRAIQHGLQTIDVNIGDLSFLNPITVSKVARSLKEHNIDTVITTTSEDIKMCGFAASKAGLERVVYLRGLAVPIKSSIINRYLFNSVITHVVANSKETERQIFKHLNRQKSKGKVGVIYHGIDTKALLADQTKYPLKNIKEGAVILGNAGRLTEQKGQLMLVEVAKSLRDRGLNFKLCIAGDGELKTELANKIADYQLSDYVELLGFVSEVNQFMNAIDVFLLSSKWEGFGFVLVEAMLKECPVVAFNTSSNPEIVVDGETGTLIEPFNVEGFADAVEKYISSLELRTQQGAKAKQHVLNTFGEEDRIDEFIRFISN